MRRFTLLLAASLWSILSFATEHFVQTSGLTFSPANITINQGDTVTWTIGGSHNVNGQQFLYPNNPASFFSGGVGAVSTYSFQFTIPGTYDYRCDPHVFAGMVGNIVVNPVMTGGQDISIVGIIDGPLPGGLPKAVEFYVHNDIADISGYSLANANNGGPFTTTPFDFPSMSVNAGDRFHIATDVANFTAFFGSAPDTISSVVNVNGDDVLGLFYQGTLVDVYGDLGVDGSGTPWEYLDGWAYRVDSMGPNPVFTLSEWTLSGINALDGSTSNSNANPAFPFETYNTGGGSSNPGTTPTYNIIDIRPTDATTGLGDSVGVYCKLVGTVYTIDFDGNAGISFWIQDQTAGINVFNFNDVSNYTVTPGDEIEVIGSIAEFNGLLEMVPDTINVISQGNPLPTPQVVTTPLDESLEGSYVRINNLTLTNAAQWPAAGNSANVDATDGTNTYLIRIDSDTDIDGSTAPSGLFDIVGAVGQFDNSSPFTSGHQVQPSSLMDIIVNTPASPTVNFAVSTQDELESAGTVNVQLTINPPAAAAGNLDIAFVPGAGITPSDVSTNPMVSIATGLLTIPFSAGDAMLSFQATINDDSDQEGNESVALSIANITGGVNVGPLNSMTFTILDNDIPIPTYDIADVKGVDANGVLDSTGVYCKIEGIVLGFNIQNPSGTNAQFTIQDATGGMGTFYSLNDIPYNPIEGDLIRMVGSLSQFNGLAQMNPDSITVLSSSNPLPNPQVVTVLDESTESQLIQINNVSLVDPNQWPAPGSSANIDITDGTNTFTMRIDSDTDVDDNVAAPMTPFDLVGIGGQFDNSSPFTDGYQILPRYAPDVMLPAPPSLSITEIMPGSNIPNAIISGDWWELENTGTTPIDINGFSWDDNSFNSGTVTFSSTTLQAGEVIIIWEGLSTDEGDFKVEWQIPASSLNIISSDEMTGNFPGLSQAGDGVAIYADNGAEICRAEYPTASAGVAVEFDSSCLFLGDATVGVNNAWNSISGDVGSPGNLAPFSVFDGVLEGSNIFPNPTSGLVNIELSNPMPASYTIFNSLGMRILSDELLNGRTQIDISALPAGIYMIELSQDQARSTARIIKR
jgi:plastocyanin/DNA/RNA endonuclease YhcR with UshA esterase domain